MAVSHGSTTRTSLCNTAVDAIDVSGIGKLKFLTSLDAILCTITLSATAFSAASGPTATLTGVPLSGTVSSGGTIAKFRFTTGADVTIIEGSVGTSGQDINLSSVTVAVNDIIQIDALSYTAAV
jgi:hypothetical protein